jgi:sterol 3beta-glucosyltransferase
LNGRQTEESNGIRLSIPLNRIVRYDYQHCMHSIHVLTLHVQLSDADVNNFSLDDDGKQESIINIVQIATMRHETVWEEFGSLVEKAKARHPPGSSDVSNVFVDFGPLSFFEEEDMGYVKDPAVYGKKELAVRSALALQAEPEVWSKSGTMASFNNHSLFTQVVRARIFRGIASSGYFVLSSHFLGFWSKSITKNDLHYRLSAAIIKKAKPFVRKFCCKIGLEIEIEGHRDLRFEFKNTELRDEAIRRINANVEVTRGEITECKTSYANSLSSSSNSTSASSQSTKLAMPSRSATGIFSPLTRTFAAVAERRLTEAHLLKLPKAINVPRDNLSSLPSKHFVCLTIGSRGDVQPYIALSLALQREGHRVTIVTHEEYGSWVKGFGIGHRVAGGDPGALMKLSVENKVRL